jgi:hypothetical protein
MRPEAFGSSSGLSKCSFSEKPYPPAFASLLMLLLAVGASDIFILLISRVRPEHILDIVI